MSIIKNSNKNNINIIKLFENIKKFKHIKYICILFTLCFFCLSYNFFYNINQNINLIKEQTKINFNYVEVIKGHAQGLIGDKFQTAFFKYYIESVEFIDIYEGYTPKENNQLIDATITFENTFGEPQVMWRNDFQIQWHNIEKDFLQGKNFSYGIEIPNSNTIFPIEFIQKNNKKNTFHIVYEVPIEADTFSISYLEKFENGTLHGEYGNLFWTYFKK